MPVTDFVRLIARHVGDTWELDITANAELHSMITDVLGAVFGCVAVLIAQNIIFFSLFFGILQRTSKQCSNSAMAPLCSEASMVAWVSYNVNVGP